MKKVMYLGMALVAGVLSLSSCSDDPKETTSQTYDDATGLILTVNGEPVIGKTATYVREGEAATLTLNSTFDLSAIPGVPEALAKKIAGPGVIPGSAETVLSFPVTGDNTTFAGAGSNDYCTYEYSGVVSEKELKLDITKLALKDLTIAGKWVPQPFDMEEDWESDDYGTIYTQPIHAVWESSANFNFMGTPMAMNDLLKLLMTMPLLDDMSVRLPDALCEMLRDVTFGTDGNIIASYADLNSESETLTYLQSPSNMAQYVLKGNGNMLFYLNPQAVIAADSRAEATVPGGIDINNLLGNVMAQLAPMMSEGVPMHYTMANDQLTVYLGTETLLPLLKNNVLPLLRNEELVKQLVEAVKADEDMGFIADVLPDMLASAADVIDGTTKLEIGLNFKK